MTHHVAHTNKMVGELKQQYEEKIAHLRAKISEQENEIHRLNRVLDLLIYKNQA